MKWQAREERREGLVPLTKAHPCGAPTLRSRSRRVLTVGLGTSSSWITLLEINMHIPPTTPHRLWMCPLGVCVGREDFAGQGWKRLPHLLLPSPRTGGSSFRSSSRPCQSPPGGRWTRS